MENESISDFWEYDVALWRFWPSLFPEYTETVFAWDHFDAIEMVMHLHGVFFVGHAAVALSGSGGAVRYDRVWLASGGLHVPSPSVAA